MTMYAANDVVITLPAQLINLMLCYWVLCNLAAVVRMLMASVIYQTRHWLHDAAARSISETVFACFVGTLAMPLVLLLDVMKMMRAVRK